MRTHVIPADTVLQRGHNLLHPDPTQLVPGVGDTRFAPLPDTAHIYLARTQFAALLESALHDATPPEPRIYVAQLLRWMASTVRLRRAVRLIDVRDGELARLGLSRGELVSTTPAHYPCTREWASRLRGRIVGGQPTQGVIWHSRQRELHALALAHRPALRELVVEAPAEVLVLWQAATPEPTEGPLIIDTGEGLGPLAEGRGMAHIADLADLLGIPILD